MPRPTHLPELLSPAGNWDCARAAVANGADAIFFGLPRFNARMRADNFSAEDLPELMRFLHGHGVKGYCAFNVLVFTGELADAAAQLRDLEAAGVDAVIAEGFEPGGHNGRDETTTMVLVPAVVDAVSIPVVAAGGISDGRSMAAALMLGAEGVQMGSRFVATPEASAHEAFKREVLQAGEGDTQLTLKELAPVRLLKNPFYAEVAAAYARGAQPEELAALLGRGRAKRACARATSSKGSSKLARWPPASAN